MKTIDNEDAIPTEELYLDAIQEICEIIYYQSTLNDQDRWLEDMMVRGVWTPPEETDEQNSGR